MPHVRDVRGNLVNVLLNEVRKDYKFKQPSVRQSVESHLEQQELLEAQLELELNQKLKIDKPNNSEPVSNWNR